MQMIHPLHAGAAGPAAAPMPAPQQRLVQSRMRARQQKILRTSLLLFVSAALICVLLVYRADRLRLAQSQRSLDTPVTVIQSRIDELGWLPGSLSEAEAGGLQSYAGYAERAYAMHSGEPAIIGASDHVPLLLARDGRYVIIYDRGKVHTRWMTTREFQEAVTLQGERMRAYEERVRSLPPELPR